VSVSLVLGSKTRGIVGAHEIGLMKPSAWLVNTSRGPLVDEASLIAALEGQRIAGAALDVFAIEPLPAAHPFRSLPNVLATSHVGFVTHDTYRIFFGDTVRSLVAWLDAG
jgi:phosphoglycerate dehydrogenase-like enzyme